MSTHNATSPSTGAAEGSAAAGAARTAAGHDRAAFSALFDRGELASGYAISAEPLVAYYPFRDVATRQVTPAAAVFIQISSDPAISGGDARTHTVVFCKAAPNGGQGRYFLWCGDSFAENRLPAGEGERRVMQAVTGYPLQEQQQWRDNFMKLMGKITTSDPCGFWKNEHKDDPTGPGCKHTRHVLAEVAGGREDLIAQLDAYYAKVNPMAVTLGGSSSPFVNKSAPAGQAAGAISREQIARDLMKEDAILAEILKVSGPGREHQLPVFLLGEAGWGKSESCRIIARSGLYDAVHTFNIHPGIDALDFVGGPQVKSMARKDGTVDRIYVHRDSPVAEAFRSAAAGRQTLLVLEEVGNVANREVLNVLKNLINPEKGVYTLETGRAVGVSSDGLATTEVLRAPVSHLSIWGTANVGENYSSRGVGADADPAVMNRVHPIYVRPDLDRALKIIARESLLRDHKLEATRGLQKWFENMWRMAKDHQIDRAPNLRDVAMIMNLSKGAKEGMADIIETCANRWVGRDTSGYPIPEQIKVVSETVAKSLRS